MPSLLLTLQNKHGFLLAKDRWMSSTRQKTVTVKIVWNFLETHTMGAFLKTVMGLGVSLSLTLLDQLVSISLIIRYACLGLGYQVISNLLTSVLVTFISISSQHGAAPTGAAYGPPSTGFHAPYWPDGPQNRRDRLPTFRPERPRSPNQMGIKPETPTLGE